MKEDICELKCFMRETNKATDIIFGSVPGTVRSSSQNWKMFQESNSPHRTWRRPTSGLHWAAFPWRRTPGSHPASPETQIFIFITSLPSLFPVHLGSGSATEVAVPAVPVFHNNVSQFRGSGSVPNPDPGRPLWPPKWEGLDVFWSLKVLREVLFKEVWRVNVT